MNFRNGNGSSNGACTTSSREGNKIFRLAIGETALSTVYGYSVSGTEVSVPDWFKGIGLEERIGSMI